MRQGTLATSFVTAFFALLPSISSAQQLLPFQELTHVVEHNLLPYSELEKTDPLSDCSTMPPSELRQNAIGRPGFAQYILNSVYRWTPIKTGSGTCIYMDYPESRGLTREEARVLLSAHRTQFEIPKAALQESPTAPDTRRILPDNNFRITLPTTEQPPVPSSENKTDSNSPSDPTQTPKACQGPKCPEAVTMAGSGPASTEASDERTILQQSTFPFYSAARLIVGDLVNVRLGSAVQLSPYVFATAAHNIAYTPFTNPIIQVYPSYNLPYTTPKIAISDSAYDTAYTPNTASAYAHDLAFLHLAKGQALPSYPAVLLINYGVDTSTSANHLGDPAYDPYAIAHFSGQPSSWYGDPTFYWDMDALAVGYPYTVGTVDNTAAGLPYVDLDGVLLGNPALYELAHPCSGCLPMVGLNGQVSEGDSGGPIFGFVDGTPTNYVLLGIITNEVIDPTLNFPYAYGSGDFTYNDSFFQNNLQWTPGYPINISAPVDGNTYDNINLPNFSATAGTYTSSLQWYSNVDGFLGTGGTIVEKNKLTLGSQTITAKLVKGGGVPAGVMSSSITITAKPSTLTASPSIVYTPLASGSSTVSWSAPSFTRVDLVQTVGSTVTTLATGGATGSFAASVSPNRVYTFQLFGSGNRTQALASTTVTTFSSPAFSASPNPVIVASGQSTGSTTISWSAANKGASYVAVYVSDSGAPQTIVTGSAPLVGSVGAPWISPGHTYRFNLYPSDNHSVANLNQLMATFSLTGESSTPSTLTGSSNPVMIPFGQAGSSFTLSWNAPGFSSVDLYGEQNQYLPGQILFLGTVPGTGSAIEGISVGEVATLWMYPKGNTTTILAQLDISGDGAIFTASSNPVVIPHGQTTTNYTLGWIATGVSQVDLYGEQNQYLPGQKLFLGTVANSGSASEPISVGEVATLWMYAHGDTSTILAQLDISGVSAP
jgi:hypothetical protein